jgi:capsular polysaccharide biosynthesis protein
LLLNLLLGLLFGGVLGVGTALLLEVRDPRVRDDSEMSQLLDVPLLGKIGYIRMGGRDDHLLIGDGSRLEQSLS